MSNAPFPRDGNKNSAGSGKIWPAWLVLGIFLAGVIGYGVVHMRRPPVPPPPDAASIEQEHQQTKAAFATPTTAAVPTAADDPNALEISATFDQFHQLFLQRDATAIMELFDTDRLCDEVLRISGLHFDSKADNDGFHSGFRKGISGNILQSPAWTWSRHSVKKVVLSADKLDAVVYDLEFHESPKQKFSIKMRWWMHKNGSQWQPWDVEELGAGMRLSSLVASLIPANGIAGGLSPSTMETIGQIKRIASSLQTQDWPTVQTSLKSLDGKALPPQWEAMHQMFRAVLHMHDLNFPAVLKDCDLIAATGQDFPYMYQLQTVALVRLGQFDQALATAAQWEDSMGGDSDLYYMRGTALAALKRPDEAAAAFRKSLDEDPDAAAALADLSRVLPEAKKSELAERFALSQTPATTFRIAAPALQRARDLSGLATLIAAYRARSESADDPWLTYYDAELKVVQKQTKEAEAELKTLLPVANETDRKAFVNEYLYAAFLSGDALDAYANAPDPALAFKPLASRLLNAKDDATLQQLVLADLQRVPGDPWAYYYRAKLHEAAKEFSPADADYASAMPLANAADANSIRSAWVLERFKSGRGLSAYEDIAPKDKVFSQLTWLFLNAKRADDLAALVAARRVDAPDDSGLPLWDAQAKALAGDNAGALDILMANRKKITSVKFAAYQWSDLYIRAQVRLKHFDAARTEADQLQSGQKNWLFIAIVECAAGDVAKGTEALDALLKDEDEFDVSEAYGDPDIGPALAAPGFAAWRQAHPNPASTTQPTTAP